MTTVDYTKDGPDVCPECGKRCKIVPDNLTDDGLIAVHRAKFEKFGWSLTSRCCLHLIPASDTPTTVTITPTP